MAGRCCTIVTRAGAQRAAVLERRLGTAIDVVILDQDGAGSLRSLLGDELERYAAAFDPDELTLAVLPRLLHRCACEPASFVSYVAADTGPRAPLPDSLQAQLCVDPWPPGAPEHTAPRLNAIALRPTAAAGALLRRWEALVQAVLVEDRSLTVPCTMRWLKTLADVLLHESVAPTGFSVEVEDGVPEHEPYGFSSLPGGLPLNRPLRRLLREAHAEGRFLRPFSEPDQKALLRWLAEPLDQIGSIPRYLSVLREYRPDLQQHFPMTTERDRAGLLRWAGEVGRKQDPILAAVLPAAGASAVVPKPEPLRRELDQESDQESQQAGAGPPGVNIVGYWRSELGVADAARLVVTALDAAEVPLHPVAVRSAVPSSRRAVAFTATGPERHPFAINLLCLNPEGVLSFHAEAGEEFFAGRRTVGYWWWEVLDAFPPAWRPAFDLVDEVWVGSRYVHDAIAPSSPVPVRLVPVPVAPLPRAPSRKQLGLPDKFLFLTVFDFNSSFERKNPGAVVRAFREAFPPGADAVLLVKSINADRDPDSRDELTILADGHPGIELRDGYVSSRQIDALLACADCVVSLHRAEGFGLPIARAMRSGIPVVATGYGGNLDFMDDARGYLVDYTLAKVPEGDLYPAGALWAEPGIEHAANQLREVFDHPEEARARAQRGAVELARTYSASAAGARMLGELRRIAAHPPRRAARIASARAVGADALVDLRRRITHGAGPAPAMTQIARRLGRPLTEPLAASDLMLLELLARLADAQQRQADAVAALQQAVAELAERKADALDTAALLAGLRNGLSTGDDNYYPRW